MANLREAFEYAAQNPQSEFATNLKQLAASGSLNTEAKKYGIDLTPFQKLAEQPKPDTGVLAGTPIGEKIDERATNIANIQGDPSLNPLQKGARTFSQVVRGGFVDPATVIAGKAIDAIPGTTAPTDQAQSALQQFNTGGSEVLKSIQDTQNKSMAGVIKPVVSSFKEGQKSSFYKDVVDPYFALGEAATALEGGMGLDKPLKTLTTKASKAADAVSAANKVKRSVKAAESVDALVGMVSQGKTKDIEAAKKALSIVDTKGVKTYQELGERLNEHVSSVAENLDRALLTNTTTKPLQELTVTSKVGDSTVTHNYIDDAFKQLDELYQKTNDPVGAEQLNQLRQKAETGGLNAKEINDLARLHGDEFSSKAFGKNGEQLTSINAQAVENTRSGIKETARDLFGGDAFKAADAELASVIKTREMVKKTIEKVNDLKQKIQKRGILEKVGRGAFEIFDLATGKFASGFLRSALVPRGGGLKVMNVLDLEAALSKNLKKLESINPNGSAESILKQLQEITGSKTINPRSK